MKVYRHISKKERRRIYELQLSGTPISKIAEILSRPKSTIYRELKRNRAGKLYLPDTAMKLYKSRYKGRVKKIKSEGGLYYYIYNKLKKGWSPEQISGRMKREGKKYYVCHETIYRYIYKEHKGKEWYKYLLRAKPRRGKRYGRKVGSGKYLFIRKIDERPAHINHREQFGHWEGDTIGFSDKYRNVTTLVERKSRFLIMIKNNSRKSEEVMGKIKNLMLQMKRSKRRTLTLDQGSEFARFHNFEKATKCLTYYCNPHSPWQRGSNENCNGRIRRFFPRDSDIATISQTSIDFICKKLNNFPRKVLGFRKPIEAIKLSYKIECCTSNLNPPS